MQSIGSLIEGLYKLIFNLSLGGDDSIKPPKALTDEEISEIILNYFINQSNEITTNNLRNTGEGQTDVRAGSFVAALVLVTATGGPSHPQ